MAANSGLCGGSIEDTSGDSINPIYDLDLSVRRIKAAVDAAADGFVLTARADGFLHGAADLENILERLLAFEEAGADVLYAPGLPNIDSVHRVCSALTKPVNILVLGDLTQHTVADFAQAGAARLSIGGRLAFNAYGTLTSAAFMLKDGQFSLLNANSGNIKTIGEFLK